MLLLSDEIISHWAYNNFDHLVSRQFIQEVNEISHVSVVIVGYLI